MEAGIDPQTQGVTYWLFLNPTIQMQFRKKIRSLERMKRMEKDLMLQAKKDQKVVIAQYAHPEPHLPPAGPCALGWGGGPLWLSVKMHLQN